jgi:hypothetical protein
MKAFISTQTKQIQGSACFCEVIVALLTHFWGYPHENRGNLNSSVLKILLDSINPLKHKLFNKCLKTSFSTSQKTQPQLQALVLRAVNSVYAKPITICELNVAFFFKEMAHMVTV